MFPNTPDGDQDPRILEIDLRDGILEATLEILGPDLQPLSGASLDDVEKPGFLRGGYSNEAGIMRLYLPQGGPAFGSVNARGYQAKTVPIHEGQQTVVLEGGKPARLQLDPVPTLPEGFSLQVFAWKLDAEGNTGVLTTSGSFDAKGMAEILVPGLALTSDPSVSLDRIASGRNCRPGTATRIQAGSISLSAVIEVPEP